MTLIKVSQFLPGNQVRRIQWQHFGSKTVTSLNVMNCTKLTLGILPWHGELKLWSNFLLNWSPKHNQ